jgi:hypothetical protein
MVKPKPFFPLLIFGLTGGYSKDYVPYCGLAVIETLSNCKTEVVDPYLREVSNWGYQACQKHQKDVVRVINPSI